MYRAEITARLVLKPLDFNRIANIPTPKQFKMPTTVAIDSAMPETVNNIGQFSSRKGNAQAGGISFFQDMKKAALGRYGQVLPGGMVGFSA